ncbi:uncharacterized protein ACA1_065030 [Acanthamoeba castellanii str. Neff]|uniref:Translation initiation factor IF2/IF5 domain-containing protein n=1 Tax=Acanthamoeba castellanii (strain ATCC 30010 / Neff) TaxID=1257118 RepID=L8H018_ACACF|nr:uncharacterized protein ACA1_065030 [Acanthamoeba castellanii str. Neff]ELR17716.1 hypothetical protein ACA1_065030 [Acanthamoeba castellanii str. Neff]
MELSPYVISAPATSRLLAIDPECQDDPFYRYQTHQLVVAFQGKRALLTNLDTVAHNLQTSADYLATYLATSLNAAVKRDKAAAPKQGGSATQTSWTLYPATFTLDKINLCFRAFLTSFVMCPSCALPELIDIVADPSKPASPRGQEALLGASSSSSSPPSSASANPAKAKKTRAGAGKKVATKSVTVRCQSCGWNEPLEKSLRRVKKNVKFVDYVLAHPPQQSSPTLI